jgi:hypothetical protein
MTPDEIEWMTAEVCRLHADAHAFAYMLAPAGRLVVEFPDVAGGPERERAAPLEQAFTSILGALAGAHRKLAARGIGLDQAQPLTMQLVGEFAEFDEQRGMVLVRVEPPRKDS